MTVTVIRVVRDGILPRLGKPIYLLIVAFGLTKVMRYDMSVMEIGEQAKYVDWMKTWVRLMCYSCYFFFWFSRVLTRINIFRSHSSHKLNRIDSREIWRVLS